MTGTVHRQEPLAAKKRPWLDGAWNGDLHGWLHDRIHEEGNLTVTEVVRSLGNFRANLDPATPLTKAYLPPLQWVMDFAKPGEFNASMFGSVQRFLDYQREEATRVLFRLSRLAFNSARFWEQVEWRADEVERYGNEFLDLGHFQASAPDTRDDIKIVCAMISSGQASPDLMGRFFEAAKREMEPGPRKWNFHTPLDWAEAVGSLASAPNLPAGIVSELLEAAYNHNPARGLDDPWLNRLVHTHLPWNETALTPELWDTHVGGSGRSSRISKVRYPVPYHGNRSVHELEATVGASIKDAPKSWAYMYEQFKFRIEQGSNWSKTEEKLRRGRMEFREGFSLAQTWSGYDYRTYSLERPDVFSDQLYLARGAAKWRAEVAEAQLASPGWTLGRMMALPAVGALLNEVRVEAASVGLDATGDIPMDWLLEVR